MVKQMATDVGFIINNLLYIWTLITHHLLSHLKAPRSKLCCPHLLSAVTLPLTRGFFGNGLVTHNLCNSQTSYKKDHIKYTSNLARNNYYKLIPVVHMGQSRPNPNFYP